MDRQRARYMSPEIIALLGHDPIVGLPLAADRTDSQCCSGTPPYGTTGDTTLIWSLVLANGRRYRWIQMVCEALPGRLAEAISN
jgi:hypothetical protein